MARQFNGTTEALQGASDIDLSGTQSVSISFWLWWDAFASNDDGALSHGYDTGTNFFRVTPNNGSGDFRLAQAGNVGSNTAAYDRATISVSAWHHFVAIFDRTQAANEVDLYMDGSILTPTSRPDTNNNTNNFSSDEFNLMFHSIAGAGYGAGRLADVAIWTSVLSGANITSLAGSVLPDAISPAPAHYWKICGNGANEPATVGSINLSLIAVPFKVAHPPTLQNSCALESSHTTFPKHKIAEAAVRGELF